MLKLMTKSELKIPEGWSVKKLGELGAFSKGKGITKNELSLDGYPCIRYAEIYTLYNFTVKKCYSFISKETSLLSKAISSGCLLLAGSGETKEEIGKCIAYIGTEKVFVGGDTIVLVPNFEQIFPIYLSYFLNTVGRKQLNRLGQGDSIVHIHSQNLKKVEILLPPLPEQKKIAAILSCWDDGIEKLSALIKKKKIQKKALMQQLLTGKHRLKGFSSPWHEVKLGDICLLISGNAFASDDFQVTEIPLIRISNIDGKNIILDEDTVYLPNDFLDKYSNFIIQPKDLLLAMSGATTGKMGVNKYSFPMLLNQRVCIIRANKTIQDFINQYLLQYNNKILKMSYGGAQPNIGSTDIKKIKLYIPSDIAEQKAIAEILSKADEEIELLNKKLEAFKLEKKALMQQLLTGKIRVKVN